MKEVNDGGVNKDGDMDRSHMMFTSDVSLLKTINNYDWVNKSQLGN